MSESAAVHGVVVDAPDQKEAAKKRGAQAFAQGLAIDVVVGVAILIISSLDGITNKAALIAFVVTLGKTILITAAQYVVRRFVDKSGFNADGQPVGTVDTGAA